MQCADAVVFFRTRVRPMQAVEVSAVGITIACIDNRSAQASLAWRARTFHSTDASFHSSAT